MVGLGIVGSGVLACILILRTRRKRPLVPRRNKLLIDSELEPSSLHFSSFPSTTSTYHTHELRATAAGDSTLKAIINITYFIMRNKWKSLSNHAETTLCN